jgi:hypothetical protein
MNKSHLAAALSVARELSVVPDVANTETFDIGDIGFAVISADSTGGKTKVLPNSGFIAIIHNASGDGTLTITDTDGDTVAAPVDNETALCIRVGDVADNRWHGVILGQNAS